MKKLILLLFVLPIFVYCTRTVYVPQVSYHREVDTLLLDVADSSLMSALLECDSNNRVVLRKLTEMSGETARQRVSFDDGKLEVRTRWRTKYVERIKEVCDTVTVVKIQNVVKKERYVPLFYKATLLIALAFVGASIFRLIRYFKKRFKFV